MIKLTADYDYNKTLVSDFANDFCDRWDDREWPEGMDWQEAIEAYIEDIYSLITEEEEEEEEEEEGAEDEEN